MVPFLDFSEQYTLMSEEIESKVLKVLRSTKYILCDEVNSFEKQLAEYCTTKYAVGLANGTDALIISLKAIGICAGDEVITTPFTFFATAEAISLVNAKPVFVDIDENTFCIDPSKIEEKITERTKAIMPVHIFGQTADMDAINKIAQKYGIRVIEDACQAIGAEYKNRKAGSIGDIGCFSFYPTKNLSCAGDGGAIVTNNKDFYEKVKLLRNHGSNTRYINEMLGYNSRLDEIQAGILNVKIKYIDSWNDSRASIALNYDKNLSTIKGIQTPFKDIHAKHVYHLYSIKVNDRNSFKSFLDSRNIGYGVYYPLALYNQAPYRAENDPNDFPITEKVMQQIISIPMYPELPESQQNEVIECIKEYFTGSI